MAVRTQTRQQVIHMKIASYNAGARGPKGNPGGTAHWQGQWVNATEYIVDDVVSNNGSSYICIQTHTSAASNEAGVGASQALYWDVVAQKGSGGAWGDIGGTLASQIDLAAALDARALRDDKFINFVHYGAKDDFTTAIDLVFADAVAEAYTKDATLYIPSGLYKVNAALGINYPVRILAGSDATFAVTGTANGFSILNINNTNNVEIINLKVDGRVSTKSTTTTCGGIANNNSHDCKVMYCDISDIGRTIPNTQHDGNALSINTTEGSADSYGNVFAFNKLRDPNGQCGFSTRLYTNWTLNQAPEAFVSFTRDNLILFNESYGFEWNVCELAGPATIGNLVMGNTSYDALANSGYEADKGGSDNTFIANKVYNLNPGNGNANIAGFRSQGTVQIVGEPVYPDRVAKNNTFIGNYVDGVQQFADLSTQGFIVNRAENTIITDHRVKNVVATNSSYLTASGVYVLNATDTTINNLHTQNVQTSIYVGENVDGLDIKMNSRANKYGYYSPTSPSSPIKFVKIHDSTIRGGEVGIRWSSEVSYKSNDNHIIGFSIEGIQQVGTGSGMANDNNLWVDIALGQKVGLRVTNAGHMATNNHLIGCITTAAATEARRIMYQNYSDQTHVLSRIVTLGAGIPTTGTWQAGDVVINWSPLTGQPYGWMCTTAGTPGTWKIISTLP
jgi:hypothetical protein